MFWFTNPAVNYGNASGVTVTVKVLTTVGVTPSSKFTVTVKLPVCVREGVNVNVDPERVINVAYVAVIVTASMSGSEYDGRVYVVDDPAPIVLLVNAVLNEGG
jgi:hypothetical protein